MVQMEIVGIIGASRHYDLLKPLQKLLAVS